MLGLIGFNNLRVKCIIGILPQERIQEQEISIDLKVKADFTPCLATQSVADTINYVQLAEVCAQLAQLKKYHLLEALAYDILEALMDQFNIQWAWVQIKKPLCIPNADCALVELERFKNSNGK
jgi:dihydroneopterin aldolase